MRHRVPERVSTLSDSMIRKMTTEAIRYKAINMGQGMPEFSPDQRIIDAAIKSISDSQNNQYSEDRGDQRLREAVAKKQRRFYNLDIDPDTEVTVVCGVTEAIVAAILAVVDVGEKVVIVEPAHENYLAAVKFAGATAIWSSLNPPDFKLDLDEIESAFKNGAKYIIFNSPHNPTGRVFTLDEISALSKLCIKYGVMVITDEIYEHITYDDHRHIPLSTIDGMKDLTITTSGIGKTYSLTGWRIGYLIASKEISKAIRKIHTFLSVCAPSPLQLGAIRALEMDENYYKDLKSTYTASKEKAVEMLNENSFDAKAPQGAYYIMADFSKLSDLNDLDFANQLVQRAQVAVVPGSSFYNNKSIGKKLVRFAFPKPISVLEEASRRLKNFLP